MRLPDLEARHAAVTDFSRNLVVEAGAGTGKTSLLVERVLVFLGSGRGGVDQVLATTFTEKAAGEMRVRLARELERLRRLARGETALPPEDARVHEAERAFAWLRGEAGVSEEELSQRAVRALEGLHRARIETIHGFCAWFLRECCIEARIPPGFLVDEGPRFRQMAEEAWETYAAEELGPQAPRRELWRRVLASFDLARARDYALALAEFRTPSSWLEETPPDGAAEEALKDLAARFAKTGRELLAKASGLTANRRSQMEAAVDCLDALACGGVKAFVRCAGAPPDGVSFQSFSEWDGGLRRLSGVKRQDLKAFIQDFSFLYKQLPETDAEAFEALHEAVAPYARRVREAALRDGVLPFDALLVLTRDLLRDDPAVRRRYQERFRQVLVDEFQDTDPLQYEIVLFLCAVPGSSGNDPFALPPAPGKLFIVGDPKQSIYRFRGADYQAYRRTVDRIRETGGAQLHLTANFRSVPEILESVNHLFEVSCAWGESPYQPPYVPIQAVRERAGGARVRILAPGSAPGSALERRQEEARALAALVRSLARPGGDGASGGYARILVLFRAMSNLPVYLRELRRAGVPFVVDGGREFHQRPEVSDLVQLLRCLVSPADPVALLAVLRSPVGGVPDTELAAYGESGLPWRWDLPYQGPDLPALREAFGILRELAEEIRLLTPAQAVAHVVRRSGLRLLSAHRFEGGQSVANLDKLVATAEALALGEGLSLAEIAEALEEQRYAAAESSSPLADERSDAVRILTIHKAKGLESDIVILPDLARESRSGRPNRSCLHPLRVDGEGPLPAVELAGVRNVASVVHNWEQRRHDEAENLRLFYVALTRARESLILLSAPPTRRQGSEWMRMLGAWDINCEATVLEPHEAFDGRIRVEPFPSEPPPEQTRPPLPEASLSRAVEAMGEVRSALQTAAAAPRWRRATDGDRLEAPPPATEDAGPVPGGPPDARRLAGELVHWVLSLADPAEDRPAGRAFERMEPALRRKAEWEGAEAPEVLEEVRRLLEAFDASELGARFRAVDLVGREVPVLSRPADGACLRGRVDLIYRDNHGRWVVADYKTDEGDEEALLERYRGQLVAYATAVGAALSPSEPPLAELWLLRSGRRVRVPLPDAAGAA